MNTHFWVKRKIIIWFAALPLLTGCAASPHAHTDVSTPSTRETIEFDEVVDLPLPTAYQNILNKAPTCWHSPFSGQIIAYSDPSKYGTSHISFTVPGKFLGSKVELVTVRLHPLDEKRTRIVGSSFVYPGTWQLTELAAWANAASSSCTVVGQQLS